MTIGVVGGGQLGRMLALAGYPLGLEFLFLDPARDSPAGQIAPCLSGALDDRNLLRRLAERCEVLTFDWENVPASSLAGLSRATRIAPPPRALKDSQDRLLEKKLFDRLDIPTTRYAAVDSRADLLRAIQRIGLPGVLKTRRLGYDGKGQAVLRSAADVDRAGATIGAPSLYEEWVPFDFEVSILGARARRGEVVVYPLNGNVHVDGILRLTRAPFGTSGLQRRADAHLRRMLDYFRYVGVLNIEFFVRNGRLIANETAPRVHNSGHWTIEGAKTSQFENHLRAICGLPLGPTAARGHCAMINLIGNLPDTATLLAIPGAHLHDYGKRARPNRKLGHCTVVEASAMLRDRRARQVLNLVAPDVRISFRGAG